MGVYWKKAIFLVFWAKVVRGNSNGGVVFRIGFLGTFSERKGFQGVEFSVGFLFCGYFEDGDFWVE